MFRSIFLILSGNAMTSVLLLVRNLVIARLISVEDFGVAATFAIVMAVSEMASSLGLQQQIVQSKDGNDPKFQSALQGFNVLRGAITSVFLFFFAQEVATFLNVPDVAWAYQVLAIMPFIKSLEHFDIHRMNRTMVFGPLIIATSVPALVALISVWPLAVWFEDYRVMLYAIVVHTTMLTVASHLVAKQPYRLSWDRARIKSAFMFGWPLLVNSALMFVVFNGEKIIVSREVGLAALAVFAMGLTLTLPPTLVIGQSAQNFFLPQLSSIDRTTPQGRAQFNACAAATMQSVWLLSVVFFVGVAIVGKPFILVVLGEKYVDLLPLIVLFALMNAVRIAKTGFSVTALSLGHTNNPMLANLVRVGTLPLALYVAVTTSDIVMILWIGIIGEVLSYITAWLLIRHRSNVATTALIAPHLWALIIFCIVVYLNMEDADVFTISSVEWISFALYFILIFGLVYFSKDLRAYFTQIRRARA